MNNLVGHFPGISSGPRRYSMAHQ